MPEQGEAGAPANPQVPDLPVEVLGKHFDEVKVEIRAQNLMSDVRKWDGQSSKRFKDYSDDVEKVITQLGAKSTTELELMIATNPLQGAASKFATSLLKKYPDLTWQRLKIGLRDGFGNAPLQRQALSDLRRVKQKPRENIQTFAERIRRLSDEAFEGVDIIQKYYQEELVEAFGHGVTSREVKKKLLDKNNSFHQSIYW